MSEFISAPIFKGVAVSRRRAEVCPWKNLSANFVYRYVKFRVHSLLIFLFSIDADSRGSRIVKTAPRPRAEVTSTRPPCARATRLTAGSPSPEPLGFVL